MSVMEWHVACSPLRWHIEIAMAISIAMAFMKNDMIGSFLPWQLAFVEAPTCVGCGAPSRGRGGYVLIG